MKKYKERKEWSEEEEIFLRENVNKMTTNELAKVIPGVDVFNINSKLTSLGLRRSTERITEVRSGAAFIKSKMKEVSAKIVGPLPANDNLLTLIEVLRKESKGEKVPRKIKRRAKKALIEEKINIKKTPYNQYRLIS